MKKIRERIFNIIQIGKRDDFLSMAFDVFIVVVILSNLAATFLSTFREFDDYKSLFDVIELVTIIIFTVEYILRLWTADFLFPDRSRIRSTFRFVFSFYGIIDLLTFFPFYLPLVFPAGAVAFRMLRVIRIFRLFKINSTYDAFNVITDVLKDKKNQLLSSISLILIMMLASSLCMYSLEHEAQPDQFSNAFSGIWWATSTLLTVGYGDIYPVTIGGKIMAIVISFLGVGMVAIPTGIISAGFVEQYTKLKRIESYGEENELRYVTSELKHGHSWVGKKISEIVLPPDLLAVMVIRGKEAIVAKGDIELREKDVLIFGAKHYKNSQNIEFREVTVKEQHHWAGRKVADLDISRLEIIVMIHRNGKSIIPNGNTVINVGDVVIIYSKRPD
jgi:voltage-gated potassium channel